MRIRQEGGGGNTGQLKKFRQGGHMGVLTNIYFYFFFPFDVVASVDVYLPAGKDKANLIFLPGGGAVGGLKQI